MSGLHAAHSMNAISQRSLRDVLGAFVTGVTVVTTCDASGIRQGVTANSFSSVSLDPPLVLWSQSIKAKSFSAFNEGEHFAVNILAESQVGVSTAFARSGSDKFSAVDVVVNPEGIPLIQGCAAYLECRKVATYPGGDHAVFVGEILRSSSTGLRPLAFAGGQYVVTHPHDLGAISDRSSARAPEGLTPLTAIHDALPAVANRLGGIVGLAAWGSHGPTVLRWELGSNPVRTDLVSGVVLSPVESATGLVLCAYTPEEKLYTRLDLLGTQAPINCRSADSMAGELSAIRGAGFAQSAKQTSIDVGAISAPILDDRGFVVAALTLVDRVDALEGESGSKKQSSLKQEAAALSRLIRCCVPMPNGSSAR